MNKKGFLSIEAMVVGATILILAALVSNMIAAQSTTSLNGIDTSIDNLIIVNRGV